MLGEPLIERDGGAVAEDESMAKIIFNFGPRVHRVVHRRLLTIEYTDRYIPLLRDRERLRDSYLISTACQGTPQSRVGKVPFMHFVC